MTAPAQISRETAEKIVSEIHGLRIVSCCGNGAFGSVFLCRDSVNRLSAIKIIDKKKLGDNWRREYNGILQYCQKIDSGDGLINILHVSEHEEHFCCLLEAADSTDPELPDESYQADTLQNRLDRQGIFTVQEVIEHMDTLISAVSRLHRSHLIHRDIKPDNILFFKGKPKLGDIGLVTDENCEASLAGTPGFIPPELLSDTPDRSNTAQDVYALGKVLYCMISGMPPQAFPDFPGRIYQDRRFLPLCRLVLKACSADRRERFTDIGEFAAAFRKAAFRKKFFSLRTALTAAAILTLTLLAAAGALFFIRKHQTPRAGSTAVPANIGVSSMLPGMLPVLHTDFTAPAGELPLQSEPAEKLDFTPQGLHIVPKSELFVLGAAAALPGQAEEFEVLLEISGKMQGAIILSLADSASAPAEDPEFPAKELAADLTFTGGTLTAAQLRSQGDTALICDTAINENGGAPRTLRLLRRQKQLSCYLDGVKIFDADCGKFFTAFPRLSFRLELILEDNPDITLHKLVIFR